MTITRTRRFARGGGMVALLVIGAVLTVAGVVGALFEQAAILRLSTNGAYEPLKTLPVKAYSSYLFSTVAPTTINAGPLETFVAIAIVGAIVLVGAAAWRTIQRTTPTD